MVSTLTEKQYFIFKKYMFYCAIRITQREIPKQHQRPERFIFLYCRFTAKPLPPSPPPHFLAPVAPAAPSQVLVYKSAPRTAAVAEALAIPGAFPPNPPLPSPLIDRRAGLLVRSIQPLRN